MAQTQESKKTFYIVLIVLLLLLNGFFAYKHWDTKKQLAVTTKEKDDLDSLLTVTKGELKQHKERNAELQGKNAELDSLLASRQKELEDAVSELEKMKKEGNYSRKQLEDARNKVRVLQEENKSFMAKIDSLNATVQVLTKERDSLNTGLVSQKAQNELLASEKDLLARKVAIGSLLIPESLEGHGEFDKSNGDPRPTEKAKKTQKLSVSFKVPENKVADPGAKRILVRILNPQGATISNTSAGSGKFTTDTGAEEQYTLSADFNYDNQKKDITVKWQQPQAYGSGTYTVILYQDGHELGKNTFTLK